MAGPDVGLVYLSTTDGNDEEDIRLTEASHLGDMIVPSIEPVFLSSSDDENKELAGFDPVFLTTSTEGSDVEAAERPYAELITPGESVLEIKTFLYHSSLAAPVPSL